MPLRTTYAQGTPNWVDLQTSDQEAAKAFYGRLLGWEFNDEPVPGGSTYSMALKNGSEAAAIAPQTAEQRGRSPMWNTYFAVEDVDATAAKVEAAGGTLFTPVFDVLEFGRMVAGADPSGAAFCLWQANSHIGASLVNEPGGVVWNELITSSPEQAVPFYQELLGLAVTETELDGEKYTMLQADGTDVAGVSQSPDVDLPNHWHVYFAVDDITAAAAQTPSLGGAVLMAPFDTPVGQMAMLADPQGAAFSIHQSGG
ncbi:VOC family protein [Amycolatopsis magusensis]|uniref:VOC family protein n=1 Tax=Amycolatopsis magusensis TaxID=882444 RepID=UPI003C2D3C30